jgi:NADH-quinone oxidoreductase subunit L
VATDIKRVLAYSTVSQLGYMFLAMGVGAYAAGIFHLFTHAFFKALLFLASGAVIHALAGEQDLRRMGGLKDPLPITYWTFLIGALAIAGVPGLSGFFSKDEILYRVYATGHPWLWLLGSATALLTGIYMFRLVFLAFHGERSPSPPPQVEHEAAHGASGTGPHLHDAPRAMAIALVLLAVGAVLAGYVGVPAALGGTNRIERFLEPSFAPPHEMEAGRPGADEGRQPETDRAGGAGTERTLLAVSSVVALCSIGIAFYYFLRRRAAADAMAARFPRLYRLLLGKYYVDEIYDAAIVQPIRIFSEVGLWRGVDAGVIDGAVNGTGLTVERSSGWLRRIQTGSIRAYAASVLIGVVLVVGYFLLR